MTLHRRVLVRPLWCRPHVLGRLTKFLVTAFSKKHTHHYAIWIPLQTIQLIAELIWVVSLLMHTHHSVILIHQLPPWALAALQDVIMTE